MGLVLAEVLPLALAIAASPFTIIPAILLLFSPRARTTSAVFLVGWLVAIAASTTAFAVLATVVDRFPETPTWVSWLRIVLGAALIVFGVLQWLGRKRPKPQPAWMRSISTATPGKALGLALVLALANPKILLLCVAGGLTIGAADLPAASVAAAIAAFTIVASLSVAIPVLLYAILGERILKPLTVARDWLERNNTVIMAIVITVIGVIVLLEGVAAIS